VQLGDASELIAGHIQLRTGRPGRQWGLGAINRGVVITCVSAWEAYIEEIVVEAVTLMRPAEGAPLGNWPALNASARSQIGRFNNPNVDNVRTLISDAIGLPNITAAWSWKNCNPDRARTLLAQALTYRHQIAHGVNPRPVIQNQYASWLPFFFRKLAGCTDAAIYEYLVVTLGITDPWPI